MSTPAPVAVPLTAAAVVDGAMGTLLDAIVEVEKMIAGLMALRAVGIDEVHRLALAAEGPARSGSARSGSARSESAPSGSAPSGSARSESARSGPGRPWSAQVVARRVAASELAAATRISESEAEQLVADSAALVHELPATLDALRSGRLSYRHASILIDEARSLPGELWASFEVAALPEAEARTPSGFRRCARALRERLHPDSIIERRRVAEESRSVYLEPGRDGMAWLTAHLPAEQAIGAYRRLTEIATGLGSPDETRTLTQRRADVFADLLIDGLLPGSGLGRGVRASVLVTVPVLGLLDENGAGATPATLEGYGPISPEVARRLAAHAPSFVRVLTHPETGTVLSVGRDRYAVPRDLKLWLRVRDETCRFPGCGRAAANSDLDHTIDWQHQGATRHDNLAHLCEAHHRLKHQTAWRVNQAGGGALEWRAPSGRAYRTEPAVRLVG